MLKQCVNPDLSRVHIPKPVTRIRQPATLKYKNNKKIEQKPFLA